MTLKPRYIDADKLKETITDNFLNPYERNHIHNLIDIQSTADVQEVRHGKWIAKKRGKYKEYFSICSLCGHQILNDFVKESKYCPNCGAKMHNTTLSSLFKNHDEDYTPERVDWGKPTGKEIW